MSNRRKQALGKGLSALLSERNSPTPIPSPTRADATVEDVIAAIEGTTASPETEMCQLRIDSISPNPRQPRMVFDPQKLEELADSINKHGVLQPILVCRAPEAGKYILLAGERRLRASEMGGFELIPACIVEANAEEQLEFAIIENVQRENLDPVEEARAYQQLAAGFGYSQEEIADRVGKSRVAVANALRLLKLPENCLRDLQGGQITSGHARAILMLPHPLQQEQLRREILEKRMSVRQAEDRARQILAGEPETTPHKAKKNTSGSKENLDVVALQERLILGLGCKVRVKARSATSGAIEIQYQNLDDLDRILEIFGVNLDQD